MNPEKTFADTVPSIPANDNIPSYMKPPVFDPALFEDDLTELNITEEQRLQFLRILWDIMVACADMGWGIEPTQAICGKLIKTAFEEAADSGIALESEYTEKQAKTNKGGQ